MVGHSGHDQEGTGSIPVPTIARMCETFVPGSFVGFAQIFLYPGSGSKHRRQFPVLVLEFVIGAVISIF